MLMYTAIRVNAMSTGSPKIIILVAAGGDRTALFSMFFYGLNGGISRNENANRCCIMVLGLILSKRINLNTRFVAKLMTDTRTALTRESQQLQLMLIIIIDSSMIVNSNTTALDRLRWNMRIIQVSLTCRRVVIQVNDILIIAYRLYLRQYMYVSHADG